MSRLVYLDASALVKLVVEEPESAALAGYLADEPRILTSSLAAVEVARAVRLIDPDEPALERARDILARCDLIEVDRAVRDEAASLDPASVRTLDAIHLASALRVREELETTVIYDRRLAAAAAASGLEVAAPGRPTTA